MSQAAAAAVAGAPAKKGKAKLLIIAGVVLALLGGGGAFFMLKGKHADSESAEHDDDAEQSEKKPAKKKKKKKSADGPPAFATLEPFTVNLSDTESDRFVQVAVVLEVSDKKLDDALKAQMPAIRNAILLLLSSKSSKELLTLEGKEKLAAEVAAATNRRLDDGEVEAVHFSQFIIQ